MIDRCPQNERHLDELFGPAPGEPLADGKPMVAQPMVNQVQLHTRLAQPSLLEYCRKHRVVVTAFCPVSGSDLSDPTLVSIAEAHDVSPAVVALRWQLQRGCVVLNKSSKPERLACDRTFAFAAFRCISPFSQAFLCLKCVCCPQTELATTEERLGAEWGGDVSNRRTG